MRKHWIVEGRVQGVGYRWNTQQSAKRLGLAGWVQNRTDGTVEIEAEGTVEALGALESWCRQGPPGASVTAVREIAVASGPLTTPFQIKK